MTQVKKIRTDANGIDFFSLENDYVHMTIASLGCRIMTLETEDKMGHWDDIVLAHRDVSDCHFDGSMLGAVVGRVANRIGQGVFCLNGKEYRLALNCGPNHIHGGKNGFDQKNFNVKMVEEGLDLHCHSDHMEEGYPGNMEVTVSYRLRGRTFSMELQAVSDQETLVNLTNHSYFNLSGRNPLAWKEGQEAFQEKIYDHQLKIAADRIACVDQTGLPHGDFLGVEGSPFDFRDFHSLGQRIGQDHVQLKNAGGYDHPYMLSSRAGFESGVERAAAQLWHPGSGRRISFLTDCPVIQLYTANFLAGGRPGKHGRPYRNRDGVALECQYLSNSIQIEKDSPMILKAGEKRIVRTDWVFDIL